MTGGQLFGSGNRRGPVDVAAGFGNPNGAPPPGPPTGLAFAPRTGPWLGLAVAAVLAGVLLAGWALLVPGGAWSVPLAFTGWLLAGPVAIGLLAVHAVRRSRRRGAALVQTRSRSTVVGYWAVLVVAAGGIALGAWRIADWVGRT